MTATDAPPGLCWPLIPVRLYSARRPSQSWNSSLMGVWLTESSAFPPCAAVSQGDSPVLPGKGWLCLQRWPLSLKAKLTASAATGVPSLAPPHPTPYPTPSPPAPNTGKAATPYKWKPQPTRSAGPCSLSPSPFRIYKPNCQKAADGSRDWYNLPGRQVAVISHILTASNPLAQ